MTGASDRLDDIVEFLADRAEHGGFRVNFIGARDFGQRTGRDNLFILMELNSATVADLSTHMKFLVPKVNVPFILALLAGDSIENVAREVRNGHTKDT